MSMQHFAKKNTEIIREDFESLRACWNDSKNNLYWPHIFLLPDWLTAWFDIFGDGATPFIFSVRQGNDRVGIAPLQVRNQVASFMGDPEICDYFDFIFSPDEEAPFCHSLLDQMVGKNIHELDLRCLRPDSFTLNQMLPVVRQRGLDFVCEPDGVSVEADLPGTWDEYLAGLDGKQRHEVKRKLRRLYEAGDVKFTVYKQSADIFKRLDIFFTLFRESRTDKTQFMTSQMERFFNTVISRTSDLGILKMGMLDVDGAPAACVLAFDYNNAFYLYNNGFDPACGSLSVGVLSKVLLLQHAISRGKKTFDFLKGNEIYKHRLGGREVALSRLRIKIS